jgi:hypothetical protein
MSSNPTYLGTVEDVSGATLRVKLDDATISGLSFIEGQSYRVGQVGGFVRIPLGFIDLFGVISQVGANAVPERLAVQNQFGNRWMTVQLVGEGQPQTGFARGISQFPTVGDGVHLVTEHDLQLIYGRSKDPKFVAVGHLASVESIPALVDIDNLPIRTVIDQPNKDRRPDSADPRVVVPGNVNEGYDSPGGWNQTRDPDDYAEALKTWRKQEARSEKLR